MITLLLFIQYVSTYLQMLKSCAVAKKPILEKRELVSHQNPAIVLTNQFVSGACIFILNENRDQETVRLICSQKLIKMLKH